MKILALYVPEKPGIYRLWVDSWRKAGWTVGLLSPREVQNHRNVHAAVNARRCKLVCSVRVINYSFSPRRLPKRLHPVNFGARGWEAAALVKYPAHMTEGEILAAR